MKDPREIHNQLIETANDKLSKNYNPNHDPATGRFATGGGSGSGGGSTSGGGSGKTTSSGSSKSSKGGKFKSYTDFKSYAHDQAALWREIDEHTEVMRDLSGTDLQIAEGQLLKMEKKVDKKLRSFYDSPSQTKLDYEQLLSDEGGGRLEDLYFDFYNDEE